MEHIGASYDGGEYNVVFLNPDQAEIIMSDDDKDSAIDYALLCIYDEDTVASVPVKKLAKFTLWSLQRLGAIEQCVQGDLDKQ
jgi:hypothetical protein